MKNDMLKTVVVLSVIAIVAGVLLGVINGVTYIDDEEILNQKLVAVYADADGFNTLDFSGYVISEDDVSLDGLFSPQKGGVDVEDIYIYRLCTEGYGGKIQLLVAVENNKIVNIVKMSASETAGMGDNGFKDKFLNQFKDIDITTLDAFVLSKNPECDGEINQISGATITSNAMLRMFNVVIEVQKQIAKEGLK